MQRQNSNPYQVSSQSSIQQQQSQQFISQEQHQEYSTQQRISRSEHTVSRQSTTSQERGQF